MSDHASAPLSLKPAAAAAYIADLAASLAAMARQQKFDALGYLLEMARLEAETLSSTAQPREPDRAGGDAPAGTRDH